MTTLIASTVSGTTSWIARIIASEATIAIPPRTSGSAAATRLRKKSSERISSSGNARVSARAQVLLGLLGDLLVGDHDAAELDVVLAGELLLDRRRDVVAVGVGVDLADDEGAVALGRDQRRLRRLAERGDHPLDPVDLGEGRRRPPRPAPVPPRVSAVDVDDGDHGAVGADPGDLLERLVRLGAVGARVLELVGVEGVEGGHPERRCRPAARPR